MPMNVVRRREYVPLLMNYFRDANGSGRPAYDGGVSLDWEATASDIVKQQVALAAELDQVLSNPAAGVGSIDLEHLLSTTRFVGALRSFRQRDLAKLLALKHGANFSVPGSGKTAVAYALYELEREAGRVDQLVIVAPLSAFDAWTEEAAIWIAPTPSIASVRGAGIANAEVTLINYQRVPTQFDQLARHVGRKPTHLDHR